MISHAYDEAAEKGDFHSKIELCKQEEILWDTARIEAHSPEKHDFNSCRPLDRSDLSRQGCVEIYTLGFAVIKNMPLSELNNFISSIGPIHYTEGGHFYTVKSKPGANDIADTGHALPPYTDYESYIYASHLLQFLYFKATNEDSTLVDGFRVAQDFQKHHPDYFQILVETPAQFQQFYTEWKYYHRLDYFQILVETPAQFQQFYTEWKYYHRRSRRIIELDIKGEVSGVYFGNSHACNWDIPFDKMEKFYEAYSQFFRYLKSPEYQYHFRSEAEDCLMIQNFQVLHGRTAFDANSGSRHLEVSYVAWNYFTGREIFRQFQHLYLNENY